MTVTAAYAARAAETDRHHSRVAATVSPVTDTLDLAFRRAGRSDADDIAALHADSWRRHYRGAYSDSFLDGDVDTDRIAVWRGRLEDTTRDTATVVAVDGNALVGFIHVVFDDDARWGALIDNLHVRYAQARTGVGTRLMSEAATAVRTRPHPSGIYLWVLEQNRAGQAFYDALGGRCVERDFVAPPGGDPGRLHGRPVKLRYVWETPELSR
jgi:ribosomal protein S18 acetylase RimI-like enzyme